MAGKRGDGQFFDLEQHDAQRTGGSVNAGFAGPASATQASSGMTAAAMDPSWNGTSAYGTPKPMQQGVLPGPGGNGMKGQSIGAGYGGGRCAPACAPAQPQCGPRGSLHAGFHIDFHNNLCRKLWDRAYCPCEQQWKPCALLAEFVGTAVLIFLIAAAALCTCGIDDLAGWLLAKILVGLVAGFALFFLVSTWGPISGGHFNPHVTLAFLFCGKIKPVAALLYLLVQFIGAVVAGALLLIFFDSYSCCLGTPQLGSGVSTGTGLAAEIIGTTILVLMILLAIENATNAAWTIGATLGTLHFVFLAISGASFNFWRFLGPAIFSGCFDDWWVYLVGPIVGGIIGWAIYKLCLVLKCYGQNKGY